MLKEGVEPKFLAFGVQIRVEVDLREWNFVCKIKLF
jgi:hypothetical protein